MESNCIIQTFDLTKSFKGKGLEDYWGWTDQLTEIIKRRIKGERRVTVAVDHVDLKVNSGEFFGILGPNGAGKTTLIKLLTCLLYPDEGTAIVNGYDIRKDRKMVKASSSLICGWWGTLFNRTVRQNLLFCGKMFGLDEKTANDRIDLVLEVLLMKDKADELPWHLSSGMLQKISLAKAFLVRTPIVFLDEPTIGLDPNVAYSIREFVRKLNKELGQTIFMSTHYMLEAELLCDRVAIINEGKIVAVGSPSELKERVKKANILEVNILGYYDGLHDGLKKVSSSILDVTESIEDAVIGKASVRVHVKEHENVTQEVLSFLEGARCQVRYAKNMEPTLEDVFITLTGKRIE